MGQAAGQWLQAYPDAARVIVSRADIARRVEQISDQLARRYAGRDLTVVAALTGAVVFLADLMRALPLRLRLRLVAASSYPGRATRSRGHVQVGGDLGDLSEGAVLVVDDILDGGGTMAVLLDRVRRAGATDVASCVLLRKHRPDAGDRPEVDYVGFNVPDEFVVGYGLDFDGHYRNLPDVCVLADPAMPADVSAEPAGAGQSEGGP